ncbi:hypothetical protein B0H11DRAFT_2089700 [Mycena galericulata]|nr:hypothetical protein B0H11DRAFT_2089700 [Mycena galericulata]
MSVRRQSLSASLRGLAFESAADDSAHSIAARKLRELLTRSDNPSTPISLGKPTHARCSSTSSALASSAFVSFTPTLQRVVGLFAVRDDHSATGDSDGAMGADTEPADPFSASSVDISQAAEKCKALTGLVSFRDVGLGFPTDTPPRARGSHKQD